MRLFNCPQKLTSAGRIQINLVSRGIMSLLSIPTTESNLSTLPDKFFRIDGPYNLSELVNGGQNSSNHLEGRKTVLISGAGPAGLTTAIILATEKFNVYVVEKRKELDRPNMVNLTKEVQPFLRKYGLLEEFEAVVAARIQDHQVIIFRNESIEAANPCDVSTLECEGPLEEDPAKFNTLFKDSGIYTVQIKDLQAFLALKAAKLGVQFLCESEIRVANPLENERISKIEILQNGKPVGTLETDLLFIAEGSRSPTMKRLGMMNPEEDEISNVCSGEKWVFGNLHYHGKETRVLSMITPLKKTAEIANVIFNAKHHLVNVAVTTEENLSPYEIDQLILTTAQKAFDYKEIEEVPVIIKTSNQPVEVANRIASVCSRGNVFGLGDAVAHSSPLAALGATQALAWVPGMVKNLIKDYEAGSPDLNENFNMRSRLYGNGWIERSVNVKVFVNKTIEKHEPNILRLSKSTDSVT